MIAFIEFQVRTWQWDVLERHHGLVAGCLGVLDIAEEAGIQGNAASLGSEKKNCGGCRVFGQHSSTPETRHIPFFIEIVMPRHERWFAPNIRVSISARKLRYKS